MNKCVPTTYPFIASLILLGHLFILGLGGLINLSPAFAELLSDVSNSVITMGCFDITTLIIAKPAVNTCC